MHPEADAVSNLIVCRFQWTFPEFDVAIREQWRYVVSVPIRFLAHFIIAGIAAVCIASIASSGITGVPTTTLVVFAYWYFIRPHEARWSRKRQFQRRPDAGVMIEWLVDETLLRVTVGELARTELAWPMLIRCVRTRAGFLMYMPGEDFEWLPYSAFACTEDAERFANVARHNITDFVDRR